MDLSVPIKVHTTPVISRLCEDSSFICYQCIWRNGVLLQWIAKTCFSNQNSCLCCCDPVCNGFLDWHKWSVDWAASPGERASWILEPTIVPYTDNTDYQHRSHHLHSRKQNVSKQGKRMASDLYHHICRNYCMLFLDFLLGWDGVLKRSREEHPSFCPGFLSRICWYNVICRLPSIHGKL